MKFRRLGTSGPLVSAISMGRGSSHSAFVPGAGVAFVACTVSDHVARVDLGARRCTARIRLDDRD
ncbi:MAG: hypothetical protein HYU76_14885 [Betaproteobacteria bacterium]|nr:hypothetical protein [Betaproteobacteria bacterium]